MSTNSLLSQKMGLLCWVSCLAFVFPVNARILNVGKSGATYTSIQAGITAAIANDTISVQPGVYNEAVVFGKSGSANEGYITLKGAVALNGQPSTILDGVGVGGNELISVSGKSYIRIISFEVRNLKTTGTPIGISVSGGGNHIEIRNNVVHSIENANGNAHGIAVYGNAATAISNIIIDGNEIKNCKLGQSESMVLNGNVTDFVVSNNVVHDNDNIGIDFIGFEGTGLSDQDQARNGLCWGNHVYNISSVTNPTYAGERSADGIYVDGGKDIVIERNIVDNCDIAFEIASEHGGKTTSNITIRNNFASRSFQGNILIGGYAANKGNAGNITIVNNTTYNGADGEVVLQNNCNGVIIKNNIFYAGAGKTYLVNGGTNNTNVTVDNNLYFGASTASSGNWNDAHALYVNPKLINPYTDLHLMTGSPAINAGLNLATSTTNPSGDKDIDGNPRMNGLPDLGADEIAGITAISKISKNPNAKNKFLQNSANERGNFTRILWKTTDSEQRDAAGRNSVSANR